MRLTHKHRLRSRAFLTMTLALPALNGCLWHTRKVPQAIMLGNVQSAAPAQLVEIINNRYDAIHSLTASVTFTATEGGQLKGSEKTVTPFPGHILLRQPESLRVIGEVPVLQTRAFDMASDGSTFKLVIPSKNRAIEGPNTVTQMSSNSLENMRPYMFVDSMVIPKIDASELLSVTGDTTTVVDPKTHKLEIRPDYLLAVANRQGDSNILQTKRVIRFSRLDMRPVEEDIYGPDGQVETQTIYGPLQSFGPQQFPGTITIKWPLQEQQILITILTLRINPTNPAVTDDQFQLKIPEGIQVQQLH
jgi:outer membrane lipoprotein-sorting protein